MPIFIDVGDGTIIVPPPAVPPPAVPLAPPPPPVAAVPPPPPLPPVVPAVPPPVVVPPPTTSTQGQPIPQPGVPLIDVGDGTVIPAPPVVPNQPAAGGDGTGTSDADFTAAEALALANAPDLADVPAWDLLDPFGEQFFSAETQPLKGGGAVRVIAQACVDYGVDTRAAIANALLEGAGGGIGDQGTAYGPFQIHATDGRLAQFKGRPKSDKTVNGWAWSANGLQYAIRSMVNGKPSAKGLTGHAAVYAIVYGFEQPAEIRKRYNERVAEYDKLAALGSGWVAYAAARFAGPTGGNAVDTGLTTPTPVTSRRPAGAVAAWRDIIDVYDKTVPAQHEQVKGYASVLIGAMK